LFRILCVFVFVCVSVREREREGERERETENGVRKDLSKFLRNILNVSHISFITQLAGNSILTTVNSNGVKF